MFPPITMFHSGLGNTRPHFCYTYAMVWTLFIFIYLVKRQWYTCAIFFKHVNVHKQITPPLSCTAENAQTPAKQKSVIYVYVDVLESVYDCSNSIKFRRGYLYTFFKLFRTEMNEKWHRKVFYKNWLKFTINSDCSHLISSFGIYPKANDFLHYKTD